MGFNLVERTNESLSAIISGLSIGPGDEVLSILGSGDQALAMAVNCANVYAVDWNPEQINFFKRRAENLSIDGFESFDLDSNDLMRFIWFDPQLAKKMDEFRTFFEDLNRNDSIEDLLSRIEVEAQPVDMFSSEFLENLSKRGRKFDKIYLSNSLTHKYSSLNLFQKGCDYLGLCDYFNFRYLLKVLKPEGLIYMSDSNIMFDIKELETKYGLKCEVDLTKGARRLEKHWDTTAFYRFSPLVMRHLPQVF